MIKVAIFTTTRAEFGILSALIREIEKDDAIEYLLFVGGSHLKEEQGRTINEINSFDFKISSTFDYLLHGDNELSIAKSLSIALDQISQIYNKFKFDITILLGDRIELLTIALNSILFKKPIIHIHGGERTEGAVDEQVRHMITKAAHIHFVSCDKYAKNIRKMGESDWRIFNTGALSIDNVRNIKKINKVDLFNKLNLVSDIPLVIVTYHPVPLELEISTGDQIKNLFDALNQFEFQIIITAPSIEVDHKLIETYIKKIVKERRHYHYYKSLGVQKYYSLLPHALMVIGNSSSGIIEVPFFKKPTVNIGSRQDGRLKHKSVIDTNYSVESIKSGINKALLPNFLSSIEKQKFKFGNGTAAKKMVKIIRNLKIDSKLLTKQLDFPN